MKIPIATLLLSPVMAMLSCTYDVAPPPPVYDYHAHIYQPDTTSQKLGDTLNLDITFESHTGEIVHHINVRIFNATLQTEVYNRPADPHVHASVSYEYQDVVILSPLNGFAEGEWVLQAKVWGESDGEEEEVSEVNFHITN